MMANTYQMTIDLYKNYWRQHIRPIREEKRRAHFTDLLVEVGLKLYGHAFALELNVWLLKEVSPELAEEWVTDK